MNAACNHDLDVSPSGTIAMCRRCGFVGRWRDGTWERVEERPAPPPEGATLSPAQVATVAQLDQLTAELRDELDASSDVEIVFMRRVAFELVALSRRAPDAVIAHAMTMCAAAIAQALAESHVRRWGPAQEVS